MSEISRLEYNLKILELLREYAEDFPEQRFHQILQNVGIEVPGSDDKWYEESSNTYENMAKPE